MAVYNKSLGSKLANNQVIVDVYLESYLFLINILKLIFGANGDFCCFLPIFFSSSSSN